MQDLFAANTKQGNVSSQNMVGKVVVSSHCTKGLANAYLKSQKA